jgi:hypothetical protein
MTVTNDNPSADYEEHEGNNAADLAEVLANAEIKEDAKGAIVDIDEKEAHQEEELDYRYSGQDEVDKDEDADGNNSDDKWHLMDVDEPFFNKDEEPWLGPKDGENGIPLDDNFGVFY